MTDVAEIGAAFAGGIIAAVPAVVTSIRSSGANYQRLVIAEGRVAEVEDDLQNLQRTMIEIGTKTAVTEASVANLKEASDRIERKLDMALSAKLKMQ